MGKKNKGKGKDKGDGNKKEAPSQQEVTRNLKGRQPRS